MEVEGQEEIYKALRSPPRGLELSGSTRGAHLVDTRSEMQPDPVSQSEPQKLEEDATISSVLLVLTLCHSVAWLLSYR